ncbi:MAG: hypothetical protein J6P74_02555 [Paludibacteraceae bacterium]|nr:hypothetical protein [Paludibacteraceae bacterium]
MIKISQLFKTIKDYSMATFVKEYDWMWLPSGLNLSPAECRVYAYIYGLTESKHSKSKGYNGSVRQLAKDLGLNDGHVSRILRKLQSDNRVLLTEGVYQSAALNSGSAALSSESAALNSSSAALSSESAALCNSPLTTPLYKEINKEMERDNNIARNTIATQDPKPFDLFNEFLSAYSAVRKERCGYTYVPVGSYVNVARDFWNNLPSATQRLLIRDIKSGKWYKERIDWVISDYKMPEPTNYNGSPDLNRIAENNEMVVAIYCEVAGIYTRQDAEDYGMQILRPFKIQQ